MGSRPRACVGAHTRLARPPWIDRDQPEFDSCYFVQYQKEGSNQTPRFATQVSPGRERGRPT